MFISYYRAHTHLIIKAIKVRTDGNLLWFYIKLILITSTDYSRPQQNDLIKISFN